MSTLAGSECRLADRVEILADRTDRASYPHAVAVEHEVLVYDSAELLAAPAPEIVHALAEGPASSSSVALSPMSRWSTERRRGSRSC